MPLRRLLSVTLGVPDVPAAAAHMLRCLRDRGRLLSAAIA
jgi:hypothetical protein